MENLKKLQRKCNIVNARFKSGLNDDDQVRSMFNFEKTLDDERVVIGYDDYQAVSKNQLKELFKTSKEKTSKDFRFWLNNRIYKCNLPI